MHIQENIENYRIIVYPNDLIEIGQSLCELINNLKEASGLCGKPLGKHTITQDPIDKNWVIFIDKEIKKL